jgi:hypothetical protein
MKINGWQTTGKTKAFKQPMGFSIRRQDLNFTAHHVYIYFFSFKVGQQTAWN